jgi:hypothetical protein
MARVLVDCARDPTAHNLWPLEIFIALLVGFSCAFVGAIAGSVAGGMIRLYSHYKQPNS